MSFKGNLVGQSNGFQDQRIPANYQQGIGADTSLKTNTNLDEQFKQLLDGSIPNLLSNLKTVMQGFGIGQNSSGGLDQPFGQSSQNDTQSAREELESLASLYKTQLCKHFQQNNGHCSNGNICHFAHGAQELRKHAEPLPSSLMMKMMNMPYNNWKTQLCSFFEKDGKCKFSKKCCYAHGKEELRKPYDQLPLQSGDGKQNGMNSFQKSDCNQYEDKYQYSNKDTQASKLRIVMINQDQQSCDLMLEANSLLQKNQQDRAYDIIQQLLDNNCISLEFDQNVYSQNQNVSTAPTTNYGTQGSFSQGASQDHGRGRGNIYNDHTEKIESQLRNDIENLVGPEEQHQSLFNNQSMFSR